MVPYPTAQEEIQIVKTCGKADQVAVKKILTKEKIKDLQRILDSVTCDDSIVEYIVSIVSVTRTITATSKRMIFQNTFLLALHRVQELQCSSAPRHTQCSTGVPL